MPLRITTNYQGTESVREFDVNRLLIGRPDSSETTGLDLSPDACVSRQHAMLQIKGGVGWLTDLGSKFGTQVNGREIRNQGDWRIWPEDTIAVEKRLCAWTSCQRQGSHRATRLNRSRPHPACASSR